MNGQLQMGCCFKLRSNARSRGARTHAGTLDATGMVLRPVNRHDAEFQNLSSFWYYRLIHWFYAETQIR